MRMPLRVFPLGAALVLLAGCVDFADFGDFDAYKEDFHSTHPLNAGGTVSVETFNGSVEVIGWEQNSVEVNGTKYASNKSALDALKIDISSSPGSVRIRAVRPAGSHWRLAARFSIRVPRKAQLDRIASSNGKIGVEDIEGGARLRTSNGGIRAGRIRGELDAQTSNGSVEVVDLDGNANLHTSNGHIRAEATHGRFEAATSNGGITVRLADPGTNSPGRLRPSNRHLDTPRDPTTRRE